VHVIAGQGGSLPATVIGQVVDESGASLPGVTVTLRSPALQVPQITTVTDDRGEYRVTPLPIGTYTICVLRSDSRSADARWSFALTAST
jgi:hypothetical protein